MRLYESEAKRIFRDHGIPVPEGGVAETPEGAKKIAEGLKAPTVVKALVLVGGKGKAGGIKFAYTPEEAGEAARDLLGSKVKGVSVNSVLVERRVAVARELYAAATIDRFEHKPVAMVSSEGGVEIEELAERSPEKIKRLHVEPGEPLYLYQANELVADMGFSGRDLAPIARILERLYGVFRSYEAKLVEINPLAVTREGELSALGAVMILDEDALFRHPEIKRMDIELRHDVAEMTEREKIAAEHGIPYLDLDGYIGMFPGGAGHGIAAIDFIKDLGGEPANFMDSGGGPTPERISKMLELLVDNPKVVSIFGARFGGISRCDDFAKGVVMFLRKRGSTKPMVMRMTGNKWREGMEIFRRAKAENPELFENIEIYGIETPIEVVAKKAVEVAHRELRKRG
ncbi:MAG: succinate--CoA ligase subunit beta [Candidatus Geothermarchaeales archaeon]